MAVSNETAILVISDKIFDFVLWIFDFGFLIEGTGLRVKIIKS
jgi:hypothetical protein